MARIDILREQQNVRQAQRQKLTQPMAQQSTVTSALTPNTEKPVLQTVNPEEVQKSTREQYIQSLDYDTAMKQGDISEKDWAHQQMKKMEAEGKNPGDYINLLSIYGSAETPEEKRKRERRDALGQAFQGLGNLIGNAANLYYTHRGGQYIDLNSIQEKHRERLQKLRDKEDALAEKTRNILANAKMSDIKADRAEAAATAKAQREAAEKAKDRAWKIEYDAVMKQLDHAHKMGQIDAQTKGKLAEQAAKTKDAKELEAFKHKNSVILKQTPTYGDSKVVDSAIGADGNIYTRNSKMTDNEAMQIVQRTVPYDELEPFVIKEDTGRFNDKGEPIYQEKVDWRAAAAYALQKGYVDVDELTQMGFKPGKKSESKNNALGIGVTSRKEEKKLGIGLGGNK